MKHLELLYASLRRNTGQSLVGILVTATIMSIVWMSFLAMFKHQTRATRTIAALGGYNDLSASLDLLLGSQGCQNTGSASFSLGGVSPISVIQIPSNDSYSLTLDTLNFSTGTAALTSLGTNAPINSMIQPYSIATGNPAGSICAVGTPAISFTPTTSLSLAGGAGTMSYPFQMTVCFSSKSGPAPSPFFKFMTIYTAPPAGGSATVIGACSSSGIAGGQLNEVAFNANQNWVVPPGVTSVKVRLVGGGGAGGGQSTIRGGGGGGAGGYCEGIFSVTPSAIIPIGVGTGGVPNPAGAGGNGQISSFSSNGNSCVGNGGVGGGGFDCCSGGGLGGTASGGVLKVQGGSGEDTGYTTTGTCTGQTVSLGWRKVSGPIYFAGPGPGSNGGASYFGGGNKGGTFIGPPGAASGTPGTGGAAAYLSSVCNGGVGSSSGQAGETVYLTV